MARSRSRSRRRSTHARRPSIAKRRARRSRRRSHRRGRKTKMFDKDSDVTTISFKQASEQPDEFPLASTGPLSEKGHFVKPRGDTYGGLTERELRVSDREVAKRKAKDAAERRAANAAKAAKEEEKEKKTSRCLPRRKKSPTRQTKKYTKLEQDDAVKGTV